MNFIKSLTKLENRLTNKIGIEIDFPNIFIGLEKSDWPLSFDYKTIENFALELGVIHSSRIYADWNDYLDEKKYLSQFSTELIHIDHINVRGDVNKRKDLVDTLMAFKMATIIYENPEVNLVILVSGDADFIPVIRSIKEHGNKKVIIIAAERSMSEHLGNYADYTINYEYIANLE